MLTLDTIREAHARIRPFIHRTPVVTSRSFDELTGRQVFFKCENLQRVGAFKIRGAMNKLLSLTEKERTRGVAAFSSGNHAQAVALAARELKMRAVIVMPSDAPRMKVAATQGYGAEVVFYDREREDREAIARRIAEEQGLTIVPPYDDLSVMAGQGTCALELLEDVPDLDCVITPCGGSGLFAGVSTAVKGINRQIACFGVEAEIADDTKQSLARGERVSIPVPPTIADGMRTQSPGVLTFPVIQLNATDILLVSEAEIKEAMRFLLFRMKLLVEPTGATSAAAIMFGRVPDELKRIGCVLSGGNVDADVLAKIITESSETRAMNDKPQLAVVK
jgi:threonine dehydratase